MIQNVIIIWLMKRGKDSSKKLNIMIGIRKKKEKKKRGWNIPYILTKKTSQVIHNPKQPKFGPPTASSFPQ